MKRFLLFGAFVIGCILHSEASSYEDPPLAGMPVKEDTLRTNKNREKATTYRDLEEDTAKVSLWGRIRDYIAKANIDKTQTQRFDFTILGGPHYSNETKLGLGIVAAGLFRVNQKDLSIPPSNLSIYGDLSTSGAYVLGIQGNTYLKGGKYRIDHKSSFSFRPSDFWGIGFHNGRDSAKCDMDRQQMQIRIDFMYRTFPRWYIGTNISYQFTRAKDLEKHQYIPIGQDTKYINTGIGLSIAYDSRDVITNPYTGFYFKFDQRFFPGFLGNKTTFKSNQLIVDYFLPVWKDGILAMDLHGLFHRGNVPWTMLSQMGGQSRMRGYYEGRYRDKNLIEAQAELRQKLYKRFGGVIWVGAGNIFPEFHQLYLSHTLLNCGIGARWELKNRVNVRLDFGIGRNQTGLTLSLNEAF